MADSSSPIPVAIIGATGYGGGELLRLLTAHPHAEVRYATTRSKAGELVGAAHRGLLGKSQVKFSDPSVEDVARDCRVVFGAIPHGAAAAALAPYVDAGLTVIDLSGDFRLKDPTEYKTWYKHEHPRPDLLPRAVYGAPELNREAIRGAKLIACPGCFATALNLALLPAAAAGLLTGTATLVGMTGSSGSGAEAQPGSHHPTRSGTLRPYKVLTHQHQPEVVNFLRSAGSAPSLLGFTPVSVPLVRGIMVLGSSELSKPLKDAQGLYKEYYADHPFVAVMDGVEPECGGVAGSNYVEVRARMDAAGRLHVICAIDNLLKGAAGQAVQCFNLMHGFPEEEGLRHAGIGL